MTDDVQVLIDGIGCAAIPLATDALRRRQYLDEFAFGGTRLEPRPTVQEVPDQRVCFVLCEYADAPDTGVQAIGERKIDNAILAAEMQPGLGAPVGKFVQPRALSTGEDKCQCVTGQATDKSGILLVFIIFHCGNPSKKGLQ